jgi:hypothetical protein
VLRETHERHAAQERHWLADLDGERQQNKKAQAELDRIRQRPERERIDVQTARHATPNTYESLHVLKRLYGPSWKRHVYD